MDYKMPLSSYPSKDKATSCTGPFPQLLNYTLTMEEVNIKKEKAPYMKGC